MCHMYQLLLLIFLANLKVLRSENENNHFSEFEQISTFLEPLAHKIKNRKCREQLEVYMKSLKNSSLWAVQMFDASGKFPQGLLTSDAYELGNYDGCIDINLKRSSMDNIFGKYCLATLKIQKKNNFSSYQYHLENKFLISNFTTWNKLLALVFRFGFINNSFRIGVCVPNKCFPQDVENILIILYRKTFKLNENNLIISVPENACAVKDLKKTPLSNIIHQFIFGLLFGVTAATIFDLMGWLNNPSVTSLKFLKLLSAHQNFKYLTSTDVSHVPVLDSLRVYTVLLIVVIRRSSLLFTGPLINRKISDQIYDEEFKRNFYEITNCTVADTYLFLNGFLAHYKITNYFKKNPKLTTLKVFIAEYIKSIPLQSLALLYYSHVFETIGDGPMWKERIEMQKNNCRENWAYNLFNLNNLLYTYEDCIFETRYFAVIAHCFLTVLIVIKSSTTGLTILGLFTVISIVLASYNSQTSDAFGNKRQFVQWYEVLPINTKDQAFPYLCGIWTSLVYLKIKEKIWRISKTQVKLCITLVLVFWLLMFSQRFLYLIRSNMLKTLFITVRRLFWCYCIFCLVIGVSTDKLHCLSSFFSRHHFAPLARLTYPYLITVGFVQFYSVATIRTLDYFSIPRLIWMTSADWLVTTVIAFVFYMTIHKPFVILLNSKILKIPGEAQKLKTYVKKTKLKNE